MWSVLGPGGWRTEAILRIAWAILAKLTAGASARRPFLRRFEQLAHTFQIPRRIDAWAWSLICDMNSNGVPMPEGAQLLKRLGLFGRRRRQVRELAQEPRAITIDADMSQRLVRRTPGCMPSFCTGTAIRDGGAAEIAGPRTPIQHDFDDVWIVEIGDLVYGVSGGAHAKCFVRLKQCRYLLDEFWIDQGLVALYIDHNGRIRKCQEITGFGEPITARRVIGSRHDGRNTVYAAHGTHFSAVCRDHYLRRARLLCPKRHVHHHRNAGNQFQWLVGQACRCQARWNQCDKRCELRHSGSPKRHISSGVRAGSLSISSELTDRASFSSRIAMPSRMG